MKTGTPVRPPAPVGDEPLYRPPVRNQEQRSERILAWLSEALDAVAGISQTLSGDWKLDRDPTDVFSASLPALRRIGDFRTLSYLSVDDESLSFDLQIVEPDRSVALVRKELEHQIQEGTFAWSIYQNRAVVVPGAHLAPWIVLHPLATPARVMGMFMGSLSGESSFIPDACQKVLSILLMNLASVMESGVLYRELNRHNRNLEAIIAERTEELRRSEEAARSANRAKSAFLANMSHEIRTPINGIVGMNSLMLQEQLSAEQREQAETIERSSNNLLSLINDILDFSKIEAGHLSLENVRYDVKIAAEDVVELLSAKAADKGIELVTRFRPQTPRYVWGDPNRMRQILTNLVGNAIKFTSTGHVVLDFEWTSRGPKEGTLRASVIDTGIGIDADKLERIFEKFTQADSSTTRVYGGTGLGLSISRQLAHLMGGELRADSIPGRGSTFFVELPIEVDDDPTSEIQTPNLRGRRVGIVVKSAAARQALKESLDSYGAYTVAAPDPDALGTLLAASVVDTRLVIVDFDFGRQTATHVARWLRASAADVRLVLLCTMADRSDATALLGTEYDDILLKPVRERRLFKAIDPTDDLLVDVGPVPEELDSGSNEALSAAGEQQIGPASRILLVEDEPVNRMVASQMLKRLGHNVDVAENGAEAIELLEGSPDATYDLVFMDCQTPVMDGFEATRQIRAREKAVNLPRTTIVALTASALEGDREKCLAAGMDDYLAKPIRVEDIEAVLAKWIHPEPLADAAGTGPEEASFAKEAADSRQEIEPTPAVPAFDQDKAMTQLAGDWSLFWTIADLFVEGLPEVEARLEEAAARSNIEGLKQAAHFLKGGASNVGAESTRALAAKLEEQALTGTVDDAVGQVARIKEAARDYIDAISRVPRER